MTKERHEKCYAINKGTKAGERKQKERRRSAERAVTSADKGIGSIYGGEAAIDAGVDSIYECVVLVANECIDSTNKGLNKSDSSKSQSQG